MATITAPLPTAPAAGEPSRLKRLAVANGRGSAYLATSLPVAIVIFTIAVTVLSVAISLLILIIGLPIAVGALYAVRGCAEFERVRTRQLLGMPVNPPRYKNGTGIINRLGAMVSDGMTWREIAYCIVILPVATAVWSIWLTVWSAALGYISSPIWQWALPNDDDGPDLGPLDLRQSSDLWLAVPIGFVVLAIAIAITPPLARGVGAMTRGLLGGPSEQR